MTIDVVIPVYHPDSELGELLRRIHAQNEKVRKIILMHTEDGVDLTGMIRFYDNIRVQHVKPEDFDHGGTRDAGIRLSDADTVVCMTQDAIPADHNLIGELAEALSESKTVVAYARQLAKKDCGVIESYTRTFNYPAESLVKSAEDLHKLGIKTYFCSNVCAAYHRKRYLELGGFEHKVIFNEDMIFAAAAVQRGFRVVYAAKARVYHSHNYTCVQQFKRNFDLAVSQAQHPEFFEDLKSETEGIRLVKQTALHLLRTRHPLRIVELVLKSGAKYMGYKVGLRYQRLPVWLIRHCTMNPRYWNSKTGKL